MITSSKSKSKSYFFSSVTQISTWLFVLFFFVWFLYSTFYVWLFFFLLHFRKWIGFYFQNYVLICTGGERDFKLCIEVVGTCLHDQKFSATLLLQSNVIDLMYPVVFRFSLATSQLRWFFKTVKQFCLCIFIFIVFCSLYIWKHGCIVIFCWHFVWYSLSLQSRFEYFLRFNLCEYVTTDFVGVFTFIYLSLISSFSFSFFPIFFLFTGLHLVLLLISTNNSLDNEKFVGTYICIAYSQADSIISEVYMNTT